MKLVKRKKGNRQVHYALQTNGTLIDEEWAKFFRAEAFLVGVSLDGYESNTNRFRVDEKGNGMYAKIMEGVRQLEKYKVEYNILSVITSSIIKTCRGLLQIFERSSFFSCTMYTMSWRIGRENEMAVKTRRVCRIL